jgi:hypothetical protein
MDEASENIIGAIIHVSRKSGLLVTVDPFVTGVAIVVACTQWEAHERKTVIGELKDMAPWAAYELKILQLGRALDFVIRKLGCWKGRGPLLDAVARIVADPRFGRGRRSFVATLGEHGKGEYGVELGALLADEDLAGYAMKALHRGANGGYVDEVRAAAEGGRPWVQSAARAYVASFSEKPRRRREPRRSRRAPPP